MSDYIRTKVAKEFKWGGGTRSDAASERPPDDPSPGNDPGVYMDEINAMSLEELENRLPQAQAAVDAIESKLEKLMALRDAAIICAAAMEARLVALQQAGGRVEQGEL